MARRIDGLVFDKDGTLFDFRKSWGGWARQLLGGMAKDQEHAHRMGNAIGFDLSNGEFASDSPVIAATAADIALALTSHLPGLSTAEITGHINAAAALAPMAEAVPLRPLLEQLKARGIKLGLATNDTEVPARAHLEAHGIIDLFDFISGYDSGHGPKPGPGMCLAFAAKTGLDPARCAMVGDSLHDLHAGRSAGMIAVAVLTGIATRDELSGSADVVLADVGQLPSWLDRVDT